MYNANRELHVCHISCDGPGFVASRIESRKIVRLTFNLLRYSVKSIRRRRVSERLPSNDNRFSQQVAFHYVLLPDDSTPCSLPFLSHFLAELASWLRSTSLVPAIYSVRCTVGSRFIRQDTRDEAQTRFRGQ
ncbi:hypothetical protein DOTSEDRAFT_73786 [Dothistroma septosporum NZE10]|uniref:Uncharacterized protein n=1 Tax=Dothistroma septosporum (strain NZE10 / CBS 128990) TaxID=675120 RepID=N1PIW6_DOTSN|nr:hypothetical protein DOTSEDRAFT_73786 [Dothistroma septosporum NZE10]